MARLVCGCGYLGLRVARGWLKAGHEVFAVTRSEMRAAELSASGIHPLVGDLTESIHIPDTTAFETVLFAVGFDRTAGKTVHEVFVHGLQNLLAAIPGSVNRLIHISSTGVYGQSGDEWVDEDSSCQPRRASGRACLAAERVLESHPLGRRSIILRIAGIYGPQRIPRLAAIESGDVLPVSAEGYLNLVHVDDVVRTVLTAEKKALPPCRYVVADGQPVRRRDFYGEVARLLSAPPPSFQERSPGSPLADRAISSKRVRNTRMQKDLGVTLRYPSYRSGLPSALAGEKNAGAG